MKTTTTAFFLAFIATIYPAFAGNGGSRESEPESQYPVLPGTSRMGGRQLEVVESILNDIKAHHDRIPVRAVAVRRLVISVHEKVDEIAHSSTASVENLFFRIDEQLKRLKMPPINDTYPRFVPIDGYVATEFDKAERLGKRMLDKLYDTWIDYILERRQRAYLRNTRL
ncbi:GNAT family N-acetyltransferase [Babesia caballi]|uniref:GNAT family N-acetyltransferase n=1 Tax=Babesia caballi TaxID=5871 RepID=A0AAV4LS68_BABCB|nr:GNAT family N-acetyltransferase [Babesia caballi]